MRVDVGQRWSPSRSKPDEFAAGSFRRPLCLFAYHRLPELIASDYAGFSERVRDHRATRVLQDLWLEMGGGTSESAARQHALQVCGT
jgi:hypothetical protein